MADGAYSVAESSGDRDIDAGIWPQPGSWVDGLETRLANRAGHWTGLVLLICLNLIVFTYGFDFEASVGYTDLRRYISPLGRGFGLVLDLNTALLVLPMCRRTLTYLRGTRLASLVPFDDSTRLHRAMAYLICIGTVVHGGGQAVNYALYYMLEPGTLGSMQVLVTGIVCTVLLITIVVLAHSKIRRRAGHGFEVFFFSHHLFIPFYALLVLHGLRRGRLTFVYFFAAPGALYVFDRLWRVTASDEKNVTGASLEELGAGVTLLSMDKPFSTRPGQYCDVLIRALGRYEWHPFTVSSSPLDPRMTFHIKAVGDWTRSLAAMAHRAVPLADGDVRVRGPYGAPAEHATQFANLIFIAAGIGATPFSALIKVCRGFFD